MTVEEVDQISKFSQTTSKFVCRLALYMYGKEELAKRRVTDDQRGVTEHNANRRPILPAKLNFIYRKIMKHLLMFNIN